MERRLQMQSAERPREPGTMLLVGEFFEVNVRVEGAGTQTQIYQALEFEALQDGSIQVRGMYYAAALIVRLHRRAPPRTHTYDAVNAWEDGDLALRDDAKELLKVLNCTGWLLMTALTGGKPRVVHPAEMKERGFYTAGKEQRWVCGAAASERTHVEALHVVGVLKFALVARSWLRAFVRIFVYMSV